MKNEGLSAGGMYFTNPEVLFSFMRRTRKPVWHKSNVHFRDIQYAIRDYMETVEREPVSVPEAERIAAEIVTLYTARGVLREVNNQAYTLNMPEFATTPDGTYVMLTIHGAPVPGEVETATEESGAPEEPHKDPQAATDNKPKPKVEKHLPEKPKIATPPWMKKS